MGETILENDDAQTILYELQNFTQGFNIDIIKLLELAREIKTRLTGKLMDSMMDEDDVAADEEENNKTKSVLVKEPVAPVDPVALEPPVVLEPPVALEPPVVAPSTPTSPTFSTVLLPTQSPSPYKPDAPLLTL